MAEIYVYYKLASARRQAALAVFERACQALSEPWPRLLRRQDATGEAAETGETGEARADRLETWMEIHTGPQALQTEAALASALAPFVEGQRHREIFLPPDSLTGS